MQNSDNKALEEYGKALVLAPGNTYIRTKIGQLYFRNEQYEEAKALAETMLAGDTTQYALHLLGDCYGKTEQPDSALFIYKRSDPVHRRVYRTGLPESARQPGKCVRLFPERAVPARPRQIPEPLATGR